MNQRLLHDIGRFAPGLKTLLSYDKRNFRYDVIAGLSVAAVALPVGIAYSEIAKVPAVTGIYSAIFPLFAYALFGSSRQLMTGPDAATCIMAASSIGAIAGGNPQHYAVLMVALTLITGFFYMLAGLTRLGFIANFLSQPILSGYLNGIALIVLVEQLPKLFGFEAQGNDFFQQIAAFVNHLPLTQPMTLALGGCLLLMLLVIKRFAPRLPGPLIVAIAGIIAVVVFRLGDRGVAVLGAVPSGFPPFYLPTVNLSEAKNLIRDAAGIMLLSFGSGVLTSKSFAQRAGYDVDPDQELIGFGAANLASGLAQGFPVTGADSRTAVNNVSGGRTQLVGIVAGLTMLAFLLFLTQPLAHLPKTALAAIIIVSALGLFDFKAVVTLWAASRREFLFSLATTVGALFFGVLTGVLLAVGLSLLWLLSVDSRPHSVVLGQAPGVRGFHDLNNYPDATTIPGLLIYRFEANLLFFNCDYFKQQVQQNIRNADSPIKMVVVDASPINTVDYTALKKIREFRKELEAQGTELVFANVKRYLAHFFQADWLKTVNQDEYIFVSLEEAVQAFEKRTGLQGHPNTNRNSEM